MKYISLLIVFISFGYFFSCKNSPSTRNQKETQIVESENKSKFHEPIQNFVNEKNDFGRELINVSKTENWEKGDRYSVETDLGKYLFYLDNENVVVGVWKLLETGERQQIYNLDTNAKFNNEKNVINDLQSYQILDKITLMSGKGDYADLLIEGLNTQTPVKEIESTLRKIMEKESLISVTGYSTKEAFKAAYSDAYSKKNPNAMKKGYLGMISENGNFIK